MDPNTNQRVLLRLADWPSELVRLTTSAMCTTHTRAAALLCARRRWLQVRLRTGSIYWCGDFYVCLVKFCPYIDINIRHTYLYVYISCNSFHSIPPRNVAESAIKLGPCHPTWTRANFVHQQLPTECSYNGQFSA